MCGCGCGARGAREASGVVIGWMMRGVGLLFLFWGCRWVYEKGGGVCAVPFVSPLYICMLVALLPCYHVAVLSPTRRT